MATHSSILAWEIPWTDKPSGLQSIGSQRVGRDFELNTSIESYLEEQIDFRYEQKEKQHFRWRKEPTRTCVLREK